MSVPVSRRCFTAGGLTLALVLSSPLSALADPSERGSEKSARSERASSSAQRADARPSPTPSATPGSKAGEGDASTGRERTQGQRSKGERRGQARRAGKASGTKGAPSTSDRDPRGNNGTIKIDGAPFDDSRGNEPHVGCDVRLVFWGFDAGDTASITFTGHAPTGGGLLHSETGTLISRDAAGGGQDLDEALVYSLDGALSELRSIAPHPKQGWHVKVAVDVDSAPGGAKQKVFWMSCPAPAAVASPSPSPLTLGSAGVTTVPSPVRGAQKGATVPAAPGLTLGSGTLEVTEQTASGGTTVGAAGATSGSGAAGASARAADRPSALPFTGPVALGLLTALGAGSVVAGGLAHRLGRRRSAAAAL